MEFKCPHCSKLITEKDLDTNSSTILYLNEYFKKNEEIYKKELEQKILKEKEKQFEFEKNALLLQKELEINAKKQQEIDVLKNLLKSSEIELLNNENVIKNLLLQKELEINAKKQQEIDVLKNNHLEEKKQLEQNIKELELANTLNKVIQNKTKGENFEHDVEKILRDVFEPDDIIEKITSGDKKADYLQKIRLNGNKEIGRIVYEVKNAEWKDTWEKKLIGDMATENSKYGILISTSLNKKYPGIMFKRSDINHNIYLVDSENFVAVGQLIKSLIKTEYNLSEKYNGKQLEEKLVDFKKWREIQIPLINQAMQENIERIESAEISISKQLNQIRIGREKITSQWLYKIKDFIENLVI